MFHCVTNKRRVCKSLHKPWIFRYKISDVHSFSFINRSDGIKAWTDLVIEHFAECLSKPSVPAVLEMPLTIDATYLSSRSERRQLHRLFHSSEPESEWRILCYRRYDQEAAASLPLCESLNRTACVSLTVQRRLCCFCTPPQVSQQESP